jgi:hypothetical protein
MKISHKLSVILIVFLSVSLTSQPNLRDRLVSSVISECKLNVPAIGLNFPDISSRIKEKFNYATLYLEAQLTGLVLSDSSSYYEDMYSKMKQLEQKKVTNHRDSIMWLNETEKALLLVCLLQPVKSDTAFNNVVKLWCGAADDRFIISNKLTVYDFRAWLYELLDNRFHSETKVFEIQKLNYIYRKTFIFLEAEFKGIKQERQNVQRMTEVLKEAKRDSLIPEACTQRMNTIELKYYKIRTDSMYTFLLEMYTKALHLAPDAYDTNYNLYRFYYNEGATIMRNMDTEDTDLKKQQDRAKSCFKKSLYYSKKIGL